MPTTNRLATLEELAAATGPCVSVVCPLDHLSPGNPHDTQTLAELRDAAARELQGRRPDRDTTARVLQNLDDAFASIDRAHPGNAVAIFAGVDIGTVTPLMTATNPRVVVGDRFALSELAGDAATIVSVRVLVLSLAQSRCIDLSGAAAHERHDAGFPVKVEAPTREETPHRDFALDEHEHAEAARFVLRAVDAALEKVHEADPRPLVLVGAERDLSYWDEVSGSSARVVGRVHGNYEWAGANEIAALVRPALASSRHARDEAAANEVREKLTNGAVCGIADVWAAARTGRGHRLVVEQAYHFDGRLDADRLQPATREAPDSFDAVDDAVREQICHDGEVEVVDEGVLADLGRIAMVLRY